MFAQHLNVQTGELEWVVVEPDGELLCGCASRPTTAA